ncbi:NB-ARC domain-containing protein [Streptomyces sp. NBC_00203]|uniref:NB-ARC domain-containing protein n=1 Tax=Streptomyces sp. NBC_00203 TaxID=2975680 RepID=UPI003248B934
MSEEESDRKESSTGGDHVDFRESTIYGDAVGVQNIYYPAPGLSASELLLAASPRPPVTGREVARPELYEPLVRRVTARGASRSPVSARLVGAGGFGKSTLASMVFESPEVRKRFGKRVYWVSLGEQGAEVEVLTKVNALTVELLRPSSADSVADHRPSLDMQQAGERLRDLLGAKPTLLVVDDVWNEQQLAPFIGGRGDCVVLITSRSRDIRPETPSIEVDEMTEGQAIQLLTSELAGTEGIDWRDVLEGIGRCPLVLELAHGELRERTEFGEPLARAVRRIQDDFASRGPTAWDDQHPTWRGLAFAAERSLSYLDALIPQGRERFVELAVFPKGGAVPLRTLATHWREFMTPDELEVLCRRLARLSLVQQLQLGAHGSLRLHDVIRDHLVHETGTRLPALHRRLLEGHAQEHWWQLPDEEPYMWEWVAYHLGQARVGGADDLLCELRWLEARMDRAGPPGLERDFAHATRQATSRLHEVLVRTYHLLSPRESDSHIAATLITRLHGVEGMEEIVAGFERAVTGTAWLAPMGPPADLPHPAFRGTLAQVGARHFALSRDGTWLVAGRWDGTVSIWDTADGNCMAQERLHRRPVMSVGILGNDTHVVSCPLGGPAQLWNWQQTTIENDWSWPGSVAGSRPFGSESRWAVTADPALPRVVELGGDLPLRFFDASGDVRPTPQALTHRVLHSPWAPFPLLLIPLLAAGQHSRTQTVLLSTIELALMLVFVLGVMPFLDRRGRHLMDHHELIHAAAFSSDGARLATAARDGVTLWKTSNGRRLQFFAQDQDVLQSSVALDSTGSRLAQADAYAHTFRLWDTHSGRLLAEETIPTTPAIWPSVAFSQNGDWVACGSAETVRVWSLRDGAARAVLTGFTSPVSDIGFTRDSRILLTAQVSAPIRKWELSQLLDAPLTATAQREVYQVAFFPGDSRFVTAGPGHDVTLYPSDGSADPSVLRGHTAHVLAVAVEPGGQWLASGDVEGNVHIWTGTGEFLRSFRAHKGAVTALLAGPAGAWLATGSIDNTLTIWNREGAKLRTMHDVDGGKNRVLRAVSGLALLDSGATLAASGSDGLIRFWNTTRWTSQPTVNLRNDKRYGEEDERSAGIDVVAASADGWLMAGASPSRRIQVLARDGFQGVRYLNYGGSGTVTGLAFSPYETHVACTDMDGVLSIWSSEGQSCVASLGVDDILHDCAWSPSTPHIAAVGSCGTYLFTLRGLES